MHGWNVLHAARWKYRTQKWRKKSPSGHHRTTLSGDIFGTKTCIDNRKKNLLNSNTSSTCPHNMVNFSPLAAQIDPVVRGTSANFNGFRILAALLHGTPVLGGVEQRAPPIFGRAAITLGIGPHCSWLCFHCACPEMSLRHCYSVMLPIFPHGEAYFGDWGHFWSLCYL